MKRYYIAAYTFKPHMDHEDTRDMLKALSERGTTSGTVAHWVRRDGRGGYIVVEEKDDAQATEGYENVLAFQEWIDFEIIPVGRIEDVLPSAIKLFAA